MSKHGETLVRSATWVSSCVLHWSFLCFGFLVCSLFASLQASLVAQNFVDSTQDLSSSNAERDRLAVRVQDHEGQLADVNLKLEKALAKASSSSKKMR